MARSIVLVYLRIVFVLLCTGGVMLMLGCSPAAEFGGEQTDWRRCEQDLSALASAVRIWQKAHNGRLPRHLDDIDMQGLRRSCPYSGFIYGYRPDRKGRSFHIVCRGWAHRHDLGNVNMEVDSQTPECISFTTSPLPVDLQERALRSRIAEGDGHPLGRHNLLAWIVGFVLAMLGLRHVVGLV